MDNMKIVTFNIKCDWKTDSINSFIHRAGLVFEKNHERDAGGYSLSGDKSRAS